MGNRTKRGDFAKRGYYLAGRVVELKYVIDVIEQHQNAGKDVAKLTRAQVKQLVIARDRLNKILGE